MRAVVLRVLAAAALCAVAPATGIGERTLASPALVDGRWYIRTERHLFAIGRN